MTSINRIIPCRASNTPETSKPQVRKPKKVADGQVETRPPLRLVFDFDGVIADSGDALFESLNAVAKRNNRPAFTREDLSEMATKDLINKLGLRWYSLLYWVPIVKKELKTRREEVGPCGNIVPTLEWATQQNVEMVIVSSNRPDFIQGFLDKHLPQCKFAKIVGDVKVFGKGKVIKRQCDAKHRTIYVGDEVRDVVAARAAGVESVAVCWGKDSDRVLADSKPTYQVKDGQALLKVARGLA